MLNKGMVERACGKYCGRNRNDSEPNFDAVLFPEFLSDVWPNDQNFLNYLRSRLRMEKKVFVIC